MISELLEDYYHSVEQSIHKVWSHSDPLTFINGLAEEFTLISGKVIHLGSRAQQQFDANEFANPISFILFVHFDFLKEVKNFLILWRDVMFQYQKGLVLERIGTIEKHQLQYVKEESGQILQDAHEEVKGYSRRKLSIITDSEKTSSNYVDSLSGKNNPWQIYKQQIETLDAQTDQIADNHVRIISNVDLFIEHKIDLENFLKDMNAEFVRIGDLARSTIDKILQTEESSYHKLILQLEEVIGQIEAKNLLQIFSDKCDQIIDSLSDTTQISIGLRNNQLLYKEIDFSGALNRWINGQVKPLLTELQELLDSEKGALNLNLTNIKNRLSLSINESYTDLNRDIDLEAFQNSNRAILTSIDESLNEFKSIRNLVEARYEENMNLNDLYDLRNDFLSSSQQYIFEQFKLERGSWLNKIGQWLINVKGRGKKLLANVAEEEALSESERIVRYLENLRPDEENYHYNNIFSGPSIYSDSFWVGREQKIERFEKVVKNWRLGYQGSVVLSGMRFSGKTTFGDLVAQKYFNNKTIRVRPFSTLKIRGRSINIKDDIAPVMEFIGKYTIGEQFLIWMDDLETWQSAKISLQQNVKTLLAGLNKLTSNVFFMTATSNWVLFYLARMFQFDQVFQAEINLDQLKEDDVRKAISIRHGVTHKYLKTESGQRVSTDEFRQIVRNVYIQANYNMGDSLNLWVSSIKFDQGDHVIFNPLAKYTLPDFLNEINRIILRFIIMSKGTNEYMMRRYFGTSFTNKYSAEIQRLISLKILVRTDKGMLNINKYLVNETARMLDDSKYISCKR